MLSVLSFNTLLSNSALLSAPQGGVPAAEERYSGRIIPAIGAYVDIVSKGYNSSFRTLQWYYTTTLPYHTIIQAYITTITNPREIWTTLSSRMDTVRNQSGYQEEEVPQWDLRDQRYLSPVHQQDRPYQERLANKCRTCQTRTKSAKCYHPTVLASDGDSTVDMGSTGE